MRWKNGMRIGLIISLAAFTALAFYYKSYINAENIGLLTARAGVWAPLIFGLIYAVATVLFLPGSVLTLAGGAMFGPVWGTAINLTGAMLGATISFLIARYAASDWVSGKVSGKLKSIYDGVEREGWRFVAFTRLVPLFPFNALNYALGLTRIRLSHYVAASLIFMLPGAFAYTYLGYAGKEAVAGGEGVVGKIMIALALLAIVSFLPRVIKRKGDSTMDAAGLKTQIDLGENMLVVDVRDEPDFREGHVPGAINIPIGELEKRIDEVRGSNGKIALICKSDRKSTKASEILAGKNVASFVVKGGMDMWSRNNFPMKNL